MDTSGASWVRRGVLAVSIAVALAAAAALLAACGGSGGATLEITEADTNKTVTATVGDEVSVSLKENPTTGYEWNMIAGPGLTAVSDDFIGPSPSPSPMMGAGGTQVVTVKVTSAGSSELTGNYRQQWTSPSPGAQPDFSMTVQSK